MHKIILWAVILFILIGGAGLIWFVMKPTQLENKSVLPLADATATDESKNTTQSIAKNEDEMVTSNGSIVAPKEQTKTESAVTINQKNIVDVTKLPLGDGNRSTSPKKGYVYSCQTSFSVNAGGASQDAGWIHGSTWNLNEKISVRGSVTWSAAWFKEQFSGDVRALSGNGLPVGSHTGTFPIATNDPAYQIDRNPNSIKAINFSNDIPSNPIFASQPLCVPMGIIGRALNGVAIYNALDGRGDDAVAHEVQDTCNGHPERTGEYHYHGPSSCISGSEKKNTLVGYALDGFGIFSRFDASGKEYTNVDLDECHGITSEIEWNGKMVQMYHYVLTQEYPYTLGCYRGVPTDVPSTRYQTAVQETYDTSYGTNSTPSAAQPPAEAIEACVGKSNNSTCSVATFKEI